MGEGRKREADVYDDSFGFANGDVVTGGPVVEAVEGVLILKVDNYTYY